jgi:hypothetical protein
MRRTKRSWHALALAVLLALPAGPARADEVLEWNEVMLDGIRAASLPPPRATRIFAMVQTAVFDAVNGIEREYERYLVKRRGPQGADPRAAAAAAAHGVLVGVLPAQQATFDAELEASLAAILADPPPSHGKGKKKGKKRWSKRELLRHRLAVAAGVEWGEYCAAKILESRSDDGSTAVVPYTPTGLLGHWKPTPAAFAPALLPGWGLVDPFAMKSGDQFRPPAPPALAGMAHALAYNEVKDYGDVDSAVRDADQTEIAFFWEDGAGTATPPGHWMTIAQQLAEEFDNDLVENARLFALLGIAQADAAISCWNTKYFYDLVRPVTAIHEEGDVDGNPLTAADATWLPLIPTPPFPAYTSGHSSFSGSSARILARFFGDDDIAFSAPSPDPQRWPLILPGVVRSWPSLSAAAEEAGQSRIYGGIHWQYDNQYGLSSGRALADYVLEKYLRPKHH